MAAEITIKEHRRKNKKGEWITVKGYTRRVGKKGVHSPKKSSSKPGDEFVQVLNDKLGKTTGPIVTDKFISKEERAKILDMEAKRDTDVLPITGNRAETKIRNLNLRG